MGTLKVLNEKVLAITLTGSPQIVTGLPRFYYEVVFQNTTSGVVDVYLEEDGATAATGEYERIAVNAVWKAGSTGNTFELCNTIFVNGTAGQVLKIRYQNNKNVEVI